MPAKGKFSNPDGPHLGLTNLRRFLPHLRSLLLTYPDPLILIPDSLCVTTFAARFRDAANAVITQRHSVPIDFDTFSSIWSKVTVRIVGETVVVGPRTAEIPLAAIQAPPSTYALTLENPTLDQLNAATLLITTGATLLPIQILGNIPSDYVRPPLILLNPQPDGSHLLI